MSELATGTVRLPRWSPLKRSAALLLVLFFVGTLGYRMIGGSAYSYLDAAYMTAITLTTLGYREVIDVSDSSAGKLFTMALLFVGVGCFLYFFGAVTEFVIEGSLGRVFWRRRVMKKARSLTGHYVVCGGGMTGEHVLRELIETQRPFALVEINADRIDALHDKFGMEFPVVIGDATEDENLQAAGIERACGMVTCMSSDKDNLVVVFSARSLNPQLRIVSRSTDDHTTAKLRRAGADAVVCPDRIGGLRLISEMIRPTVVSFLDSMLRDPEARLRVEEAEIRRGSVLENCEIGELKRREISGLILIGTGSLAGDWSYNPDDHVRLSAGSRIIFIGDPTTRQTLEQLTAPPVSSTSNPEMPSD